MDFISIIPFIVMVGAFYFLLIKPQQKQAKQKQEMLTKIKAGDSVITIGGLHAIVDDVNQANNTIVLDCEGIYLTYSLSAIATVTPSADVDELEEVEEVIVENEEA